jgi:hypothetical protein
VLTSRREKEAGQGRQQGFSSPANVVNILEKAQIARRVFLRYASFVFSQTKEHAETPYEPSLIQQPELSFHNLLGQDEGIKKVRST